jgi:hypothetical protein
MTGRFITACDKCGTDPCRGQTPTCDVLTYFIGNPTKPAHVTLMSDEEYQASRTHTLGIGTPAAIVTSPSGPTWVTHRVVFDGKQWVYANEAATPPVTEPTPETKRACECGVWATGGLHSDWCPCAGGDCAQAEST